MKKYYTTDNHFFAIDSNTDKHLKLSEKFKLSDGFPAGAVITLNNCTLGSNFSIGAMSLEPIEKLLIENTTFNDSDIMSYAFVTVLKNFSYIGNFTSDKYADITIVDSLSALNATFIGESYISISPHAHFDIAIAHFYGTRFRVFDCEHDGVSMFLGSTVDCARFSHCKFEYGVFKNVMFSNTAFDGCDIEDLHFNKKEVTPAFRGCTFTNCTFNEMRMEEAGAIFEDCVFHNCREFKTIGFERFKNCKWE